MERKTFNGSIREYVFGLLKRIMVGAWVRNERRISTFNVL